MASAVIWTLGAVILVSLVSLIGALTLSFGILKRHSVMMALIAIAAGTLLGDALLHLLPEATSSGGFDSRVGATVLAGFLMMFGIEVALRRSHSHVEAAGHHDGHATEHAHGSLDSGHSHAPFGWINLVGDGLHNLLDGVILAAAFIIDVHAGIATTIAVLLHEVPQELGDFAVLVRSGMSTTKALLLNLGSALFALIGAAAVLVSGISAEALEPIALPLIAGAFIYIAAADLIPELHHHSKGRDVAIMVIALLVGITIMGLLLGLESIIPTPGHDH